MKTTLYTALFMISGLMFSQETSRDLSKETETKTVTIDNGREVTEKKVKITTTEKADVKLSKADENKVNQERIINESDKKITKTVEIDNDDDPFYDSKVVLRSYQSNGTNYNFKRNSKGFEILSKKKNNTFGQAIKSAKSEEYLIKGEQFSGTGYFNSDGNFVITYYNENTQNMESKTFYNLK
ncbi:hypothetical protein ACW5R3_07920 [Bizionia sp. KMM 8389]